MFFILQAILALAACVFFFALQGYRVLGLCCLGLMAVLWFYRLAHKLRKGLVRLVTVLLCLGLAVFAVTEGFIIHGSLGAPQEGRDYLIVLGAKVNPHGPSMALRDRINAAYDYLTAHPDCTAILSGGQGSGENISEAEAMYRALAPSFPEGEGVTLLREDDSTSTAENFAFSKEVLIRRGLNTEQAVIAVVTNDFHCFRARFIAQREGLTVVFVPAELPWPWLTANYYLRESFALVKTALFD